MDGVQLRDEAAQDRVRVATEFLDPGMLNAIYFKLLLFAIYCFPSFVYNIFELSVSDPCDLVLTFRYREW